METTRVFDEVVRGFSSGARYIDSCGGTRSGKTYSTLQFLVILAMYSPVPVLVSVVSETLPHLKKGAIRDFQEIMEREGLWSRGRWHDGDKIYTFPSGSRIEFFSADSPAKVHGPGRDYLFINEAQNIPYETARQLFIRTRRTIFIDYNPVTSFWVHDRIKDCDRDYGIHSTYRDNPFLSAEQVAEIESYRGESNWWRVYGEGLTGVLEGLIYSFTQIDGLPDTSGMVHALGLDFGYTNDVTALVDAYIHRGRREIYADELIYRRGMLNDAIAREMQSLGVSRTAPVYVDAAEPKSRDEIRLFGFNCWSCLKGDVTNQVSTVQQYRLFLTKRSVNMIREARSYVWRTDRDGVRLNEPIDDWNHAMDALRYAVIPTIGSFSRRPRGISVRNSRRQ